MSEEVKDYATITILVKSDQVSATDGLSLEYSPNGTNWDDVDLYTIAANSAKALTLFPEGRFFRIVYTNGGVAQTFFRLQAIYHPHRTKPSSHRVGDLAGADIAENDAELVFGVTVGNEMHDDPDSQGPVKIGGKAATSTPAAVAASDRVDAYFDEFGRQAIFDGGASVTVDAPVATPVNVQIGDGTETALVSAAGELSVDVSDRAARDLGGVDIVAALPIGANRIGKVTIRDSADAADIDPLAESTFTTRINVQGQQAMAASTPVVVASDQSSLTVDAPVGTPVATRLSDGAAFVNVTANRLEVDAVGVVDHGTANPAGNNPIMAGLEAIAHGTNPTAVAAAAVTNWYANRAGVPFVIGGHPNIVTLRANFTTSQTDQALVTVAGGLKIVVTRISALLSNAASVDVDVLIGFGAVNTPTTTGVVLSHPDIAPGSGVVEGSGAGILGVGADGEDLRLTSGAPTSGSLDIVMSYYTIES
ncbi:MAG: hypothetical protein LN413_00615 [Candidatus Thermoplasmatota archaeon]|nr:hypothetical protein [Candidatus Thermoplasmatota archaeon]